MTGRNREKVGVSIVGGPYWFRGCRGLQPSKVREDHWSFDRDLEGVRSLGAVLADGSFVWSGEGRGSTLRVLLGFRGCEGPQPSKIREDHWSFDRDLEGVRSLGAALDDGGFVLVGRR